MEILTPLRNPEPKTATGAVKHNESICCSEELALPDRPPSPIGGEAKSQKMTPEEKNGHEGELPTNGHELDAFLGKAFDERPIWAVLWESVKDVFFPVKLPPLELTSEPIPVPDRMAVKPNPWAIGISTTVNVSILCVLLFFVGKKVLDAVKPQLTGTNIDISDYTAPKAAIKAGGGGGGGDRSMIEANKGRLPQKSLHPILPPQAQTIEKPKLPEPPTINVQKDLQLPDNSLPMIGVHSSTNVQLASSGSGSGGGMGTNSGGGLGSGSGNGYGPGSGGNAGGGVYQVGGAISDPVPIYAPDPEFSDEARRAKYQGVCVVSLIVDAQGNPHNVHVVRSLGMGLDEKAIETVQKWKFKPALKDGKIPVPVYAQIEVDFHLY